jgi:tetratricopeptide (TPR) repeat protein
MPTTVRDFNKQGLMYYDSKDYNSAVKSFKQALKLKPEDYLVHYNIGTSYKNWGKCDEAIKHLNLSIKYFGEHKTSLLLEQILESRGWCYFHEDRYDEAYSDFTKAIEGLGDRNNFSLWSSLQARGYILLLRKNYRAALGDFNRLLGLGPEDETIRKEAIQGKLYAYIGLGDRKSALEMIKKAEPYFNRNIIAVFYHAAGETKKAFEHIGGKRKGYIGLVLECSEEATCKVLRVNKDSPAEKAGLLKGDILLKFGDEPIMNSQDFVNSEFTPGQRQKLTVRREGSEREIYFIAGRAKELFESQIKTDKFLSLILSDREEPKAAKKDPRKWDEFVAFAKKQETPPSKKASVKKDTAVPDSEKERKVPSAISGKRWAVVIGISDYQDTRISPLRYASEDARAFYGWLVSPDGGKYAPSNVKLLLNNEATGINIKDTLFDWLKQAIEEDVVIIYFAGHGSPGSPDSPDNLFLLPYDVDYDKIATTGFPMWDIETALKRFIKAKKVIVMADACHSGGVGSAFDIARRSDRALKLNPISSGLQNLSQIGDGVAVISASDDRQYSQESQNWGGGHGVFTYFLLEGLKGEADYNSDTHVTLGELIPYLSEQVRRATRNSQSPTVAGKFDPALGIGK